MYDWIQKWKNNDIFQINKNIKISTKTPSKEFFNAIFVIKRKNKKGNVIVYPIT